MFLFIDLCSLFVVVLRIRTGYIGFFLSAVKWHLEERSIMKQLV